MSHPEKLTAADSSVRRLGSMAAWQHDLISDAEVGGDAPIQMKLRCHLHHLRLKQTHPMRPAVQRWRIEDKSRIGSTIENIWADNPMTTMTNEGDTDEYGIGQAFCCSCYT